MFNARSVLVGVLTSSAKEHSLLVRGGAIAGSPTLSAS